MAMVVVNHSINCNYNIFHSCLSCAILVVVVDDGLGLLTHKQSLV